MPKIKIVRKCVQPYKCMFLEALPLGENPFLAYCFKVYLCPYREEAGPLTKEQLAIMLSEVTGQNIVVQNGNLAVK